MSGFSSLKGKIDWVSSIIPFAIVLALMIVFMLMPEQSKIFVDAVRGFLGDTMGLYYAVFGFGVLITTVYMACSKYGKIKLGDREKPLYGNFKWGTMIFTSTMAADILFYSLCEWALYGGETHLEQLGGMQMWAPTFTLFHWGPIAWSFYVILAIAFGFMMHVRKRNRQRFSEACRPLFGSKVDGALGKVIDITAIFSIVCATATTFSLATPLLSKALSTLVGVSDGVGLTIMLLLLICAVYTLAVWFGLEGISRLATYCTYLFFALLFYFLFLGGETRYILETGFQSLGNMAQNFIGLSTYMDPLRENNFPQNWTIYYWAYWIAWCCATPFFIALISKGRTIRNVVFGTYGWGLAGTFMSFIIIGNYGLAQQMKHGVDIAGFIGNGGSMYEAILKIFDTLPLPALALGILAITMIAFYSTTFDGITYVASSYSYKNISADEEPDRKIRSFWSLMLILFPIGLLFAQNSLYSIQSVTIIAAFPIVILSILITVSFIKDVNQYLRKEAEAMDKSKQQ